MDKKKRALYAQFMRDVININETTLVHFRAYVDNEMFRNLSITDVQRNVSTFLFKVYLYIQKIPYIKAIHQ